MLYVGMLEKKYTDMKRTAFWLFAGLNIAGIVMATCIAFILARAIVRPVLMLKRGFSELEKGNFDSPVAATASDEIGSLAESFNKVRTELKNTYAKLQGKIEAADEDLKKAYLELQEKQDMLVQKEKLASIGQLSAGVAHELNNPLVTILVFSRMLLKELPPDDPRRADIEMIANEADRCRNIVRGLVDFARQSRVNKETIQPADTIHEVMQIMSEKAALCGVTISEEVAHELPDITADGAQLKQMLINLIDNAIDAAGQSGTVRIAARPAPLGSGIELTVSDTGCGIPENCISEIFTPFFTTKEMGKGTGLGLAIVYGIVKMHSGSIDVDSTENKGTTFRITIPDMPAASPDQPADSKT
jgi:two-component system NtrC family sensor kinase